MKVLAMRLHPGQDLLSEIIKFCQDNDFKAAFIITCVGSLTQAGLRLANQPGTTFYKGFFEIVSLTGTISPDGAHLHLSISDSNGKTFGGHLMPGSRIYTTAEIILGELAGIRFTRPLDAVTGYDELVITDEGSGD
jgi:predicted DNA-binding protein with PD1-like motif